MRGLGKAFPILENRQTGARKVDKQQFYFGLKEQGVAISKKEAESLLEFLDRDDDGLVDYNFFLSQVRGHPSSKRQAFIDKSFFKFDKDGTGVISTRELKGVFDCSGHP